MAHLINGYCASLVNSKVNERKQACESLLDLLKDKDVKEALDNTTNGDDWESVFKFVKQGINRLVEKLQEEKRKTGKFSSTTELQLQKLNDLLVTVAKEANRNVLKLEFRFIFNYFKTSIDNNILKNFCLSTWIIVLEQAVLSKNFFWGHLSPEEWTELYSVLKNLHQEDSNLNTLRCIKLVYRHGCKHKLPLQVLKDDSAFIAELCRSVISISSSANIEDVLELLLEYCSQLLYDYREQCCSLGENFLTNFLDVFQRITNKISIRTLILEIAIQQMEIHHPNGAVEFNELAYAHSWVKWKDILKYMYSLIENILLQKERMFLRGTGSEFKLHPTFCNLAVEVYNQMFYLTSAKYMLIINGLESSGEPSSKKKCYEGPINTLIEYIEYKKDWHWIELASELFNKYPKVLSVANYERLVKFLIKYLSECRNNEVRSHIFMCFKILLQYKFKNEYDVILDWKHVFDAAHRSIGLNQNLKEAHEIIQELIKSRSLTQPSQILNTYLSSVVTLNEDSLMTINLFGQFYTISEMKSNAKIQAKETLLKWILLSENNNHFAYDVTPGIVINLILKTWSCVSLDALKNSNLKEEIYRVINLSEDLFTVNKATVDVNKIQTTLDVIALNKFLEITEQIMNKILKSAQTIVVYILNTAYFYSKLMRFMKVYSLENCYEETARLLAKILPYMWEILILVFSSDNYENIMITARTFLKILEVDKEIGDFIKASVDVEFIKALFPIITSDRNDSKKEVHDQVKTLVLKILCVYSVNTADYTQERALDCLLSGSLDVSDPYEYKQSLVILESLKGSKKHLSEGMLQKTLVLIRDICSLHYQEYEVVCDMLKVLNSLWSHIGVCKNNKIQENFILILQPFFTFRNNYGREVSVALVNCFGEIVKTDPNYVWSKWPNGDHIILSLTDFLCSDFIEVRIAAIKNLLTPFSKNENDLVLFNMQKMLFNKVKSASHSVLSENHINGDDVNNKTVTVLYTFGTIIATNCTFRKNALFEIFNIAYIKQIDLAKVKTILCKAAYLLGLPVLKFLENSLTFLLNQWSRQKNSLKDFPFSLFDTNQNIIYKKYVSHIIPIIIQEDDSTLFENVCSIIKKSPEQVMELAYPNIAANELVSKVISDDSLEFNASPENIGINNKVRERIESFLTQDQRMRIKVDNFVQIIVNLVEFIFDLKHLSEKFGIDCVILKPDLLFISVDKFHSIVDVYMKDIQEHETSLMTYLIEKEPKKLQALLMTLILKVSQATTSDEKIMKFHQYSICLDLTLPHFRAKHSLAPFLIRDITCNLINIIKNNPEDTILNLLAIKYLQHFISSILPEYSEVFTNFVIHVITTLVPLGYKEGPLTDESIKVIAFIFRFKKHLFEVLKVLDPFPNNRRFTDLQAIHTHIKYGKQSCNLKTQIQLFLKAKDYMSKQHCRTEGLLQLRSHLRMKKKELKELYAELYKMRGSLEESCLHQLVCTLVTLSTSKFPEESAEATKCLGELGISDLTTMVLKTEEKLDNFEGTPMISLCSEVIKLLLKYIVDENIDVAIKSSNALYKILDSYEGKQSLTNGNFDNIDEEYLKPFMSYKKFILSNQIKVQDEIYMDVIDDAQLWCPDFKIAHPEWIKNLVTRILDSFDQNSFYTELIPVVKLKVEFAEKMFPYLVNLILDMKSDSFNLISNSISSFFESFWKLYWGEKKEEDFIFMQKPAVQCMLNTVHFVRINRHHSKKIKGTTRLDLNLNYLHVALAANFCSAHFSAIMYAEIWSESAAEKLIENKHQNTNYTSKLKFISSYFNESAKLHKILRQTHSNIGDINSLQGFQALNPLNPQSQVEQIKDLNRWDLVVLHYDIQSTLGNNNHAQEQLQALKNFSLFDLLNNYKNIKEYSYECLWRLGQWDVDQGLDNERNTFEYHQYFSLKAFKEEDRFNLNLSLNKGRGVIVNSLKHASLESCREVYEPLQQLQCLQELEDAQAYFLEDKLDEMIEGWDLKNMINPAEFKYQEQVLSERITILKILSDKGKETAKKALVNSLLNLAELARLDGNLNMANRAIYNLFELKGLDQTTSAKIIIENVQILWKIDKSAGARALKEHLDTYKDPTWVRSHALKLYGTWMTEMKSESSRTIISDYFLQSINILKKVAEKGSIENVKNFYQAYEALALYADQEYQELFKYTKSSLFQGKVQNMEKLERNAKKLSEAPNANSSDDIRRAIVTCERQSLLDKREIENTHEEMNLYLSLALKYYLFHILKTNQNNTNMFRILSLCLQNRNNKEVVSKMKEYFSKIETYKLVDIIPQLVPHITNESSDEFSNQINLLIERCAKEHPHHVLQTILSVANANKDHEYSDTSASTDLNEPRMIGAQKLIASLKKSPMFKNMISQMEQLADALIQLAYYQAPQRQRADDKTSYNIPGNYKIRSITNYTETLVPTLQLAVNKSGNYENIIGVYKYSPAFSLVGGINAPKLVKCVGTDGVTRNQLVKGKDDIRQDAVMQQVFNIMNGLLSSNKNTFELLIRTYKIIPLSKRSGVLEWVDNTEPLGYYLVGKQEGVHLHYYKKDWTVDKCRSVFKGAAKDSYDNKLKKYLEICKHFRPAFHKFFQTTFLQPTICYERRRAYTQSVATTSMCGYILGIGDRHVHNILIDKKTAEVIHIDFGIAFEQGKVLPTPETVPFRLSRDIEDGMGVVGTEGTFRRSCEKTMEVLRNNASTIITILEVLLYDPLYAWTVTPAQAYSRQMDIEESRPNNVPMQFSSEDTSQVNVTADRALNRLRQKLQGTEHGGFTSVEGQVARLIQQARDPANLSKMFYGWQPYL